MRIHLPLFSSDDSSSNRSPMLPQNYSSAEDALRTNEEALLAVFQKYGVTNPRLFGSVARGEADERSDIDILVSKTAPMDYATIGRFRREVIEAVGWSAHVVFETALKPEILAEIKRDLRPLY